MKECFLALAILDSWALVLLLLACALGRYELAVSLAQSMCVLSLLACLVYSGLSRQDSGSLPTRVPGP